MSPSEPLIHKGCAEYNQLNNASTSVSNGCIKIKLYFNIFCLQVYLRLLVLELDN
jgi:hypothetical protein